MKYRIMRTICMFDLPMDTPEDQRNYRKFRKELIKEGFIMVQFSVYVRTCPNRDFSERLGNRIKKVVPPKGNIRLLSVTEKQYQDMKLLVGSRTTAETAIGTERLIII